MSSWCSGQDVDLALGNMSKLLLYLQAVLPLGAPWHGNCPHPVPLRQCSSQQRGHLPTAMFGREMQWEWGYWTVENNKINKEDRLVRYHEWKKIQCKFWASLGTCCLVTVWTEEQWGSFWSLVVLKLLTSAADKNGQKILGFFLGLLFPNDEGLGVAVITQEPLLQPPSSLWLNNVPGNWK